MSRSTAPQRDGRTRRQPPSPLLWQFDGDFARCLDDVEDTLRRAIVQVGDVAAIVVGLDVCLPALAARVAAGDAIQPAWSRFLARVRDRYGLPGPLRVRYRAEPGPLATLVLLYRS